MKIKRSWLRSAATTALILGVFVTTLGAAPAAEGPTPEASGINTGTSLFLPVISNMAVIPPAAPQSYYIRNNDPQVMYTLGCGLGAHDQQTAGKQDNLVILAFGQMWTDHGTRGVYSYGDWVSLTDLQTSIKEFVIGYYNCTGDDTDSQLTLGVGTSNYGTFGTGSSSQSVLYENAYAYGQSYANMLKSLQSWLSQTGYASQVYIAAAIDIEWGGDYWNSAHVTRGWVDGFKNNNGQAYFNFGACAGCWTSNMQNWSYDYPFSDAWTASDIWYVSWGARPALIVPEIYSNNGTLARQWQAVSKYAAQYQGGPMIFSGVMTQYKACQQVDDPSCETLDNTPEEGWQQLYDALNSDDLTKQETLQWATDIGWQ